MALSISKTDALFELARRRFEQDPVIYAQAVLGQRLTEAQQEIARAVVNHRRVMVTASHGVGKSHLVGGLVNWHYDTYRPGITITTAPTAQQVDDVIWKEVRRQRQGRPGLYPKASRMESKEDHFAVGLTAGKSDAFQGRHEQHVLIAFDEAVGVDAEFWDAAEGMMTTPERRMIAIMNPTDISSRAYEEYCSGRWHLIRLSAMDHPNILAELRGEDRPFPAAVSLSWLEEKIESWCTPLGQSEVKHTDFEWPPGSGVWFRPGPLFESRVMGRWPSSATNSVWSQSAWEMCLTPKPMPQEPLILGVDVARFGDDFSAIHARRGVCSLRHEAANGWSTQRIASRIREIIGELREEGEDIASVIVAIDDDGVGGGVVDALQDDAFQVLAMNGAATPRMPQDYPNVRSEAWFTGAEKASRGEIDVSRLQEGDRHRLMTQLMAPTYSLDASGRRVVEKKEVTKKRIKRSPDDADAFNLCQYARRESGWAVISL